MLREQSRLWLVAALFVVVIHLSVTFLTTLAAEDWRQCFDAADRSLPHRYAVREYPWAKYMAFFVWSLASAAPAVIGLALLQSRAIALLCAVLLAPLIWIVVGDFSLMLGELVRGEAVTAQGGYHHCDRKGYTADFIRIWMYVASVIIGLVVLAIWFARRSKQQRTLHAR